MIICIIGFPATMLTFSRPSKSNHFLVEHACLMRESYAKLLKQHLLSGTVDDHDFAEQLFYAPFALLTHNTETDPVFNYANRTALRLFEYSWEEFTVLPSRLSAEPVKQRERKRLLREVSERGYIDNYQGIRISKFGKRFSISKAVVWNLVDAENNYKGQAACIKDWRML